MLEWLLSLLTKASKPEPQRQAELPPEPQRQAAKTREPTTVRKKAIGGVAAASVLAAILTFTKPWEGVRYKAYRDLAGVPTICVGRTKGVRMGDTATAEQCDAWFKEEVVEFDRAVRQCITREPTPQQEVAFVDIAYNTGVAAFCGSTYVKKFNAGDDYGACEGLLAWDKVRINGQLQRVDWQVRRRNAESTLCKTEVTTNG